MLLSNTRILALALAISALSSSALSQQAPKFSSMTATRILVLPAQEVAGTAESRAWLTRFDSVFTVRLEEGGIGPGWSYPRDAIRYARSNPTYVSDPHFLGAQLLRGDKVKPGNPLPEPLASRLRALIAIADGRTAMLPVIVRIDTTVTPRVAKLSLMFLDAKLSRVDWVGTIEAKFTGASIVAADSIAFTAARLFVAN